MNYHNITTDDMLNGDGLRVVLWTAGCMHHCKGCQNPITWDPNGGIPFDETAEEEFFEKLSKDYISGATFSGGDPLHPSNRQEILRLAKKLKTQLPTKTIWLYTGYRWEEISNLPIIPYLDVLVDGRFELEHRDPSIPWCGSPNQRIISVQESLQKSEVVLHHSN